jgi:serine/threonine protein kinase
MREPLRTDRLILRDILEGFGMSWRSIRWEEAVLANQPPLASDEMPPELRPRAREGLRLLRGFVRMAHGLTTPAPPGDAPPAPPDTPRYHFEAFLARGGMTDVWRGCDSLLAREVALKVLRERVFGDSEARAHFEEEARHVSQLEHPSIVPVHDLSELPDGRPFFVMKLVHGQTLAELLAARATPAEDLPRWVEVFEQVCAAVAFAHARDLIHRDLKPSNVMLGEFGEVLVMDSGIAKALAARPGQVPPGSPRQYSICSTAANAWTSLRQSIVATAITRASEPDVRV